MIQNSIADEETDLKILTCISSFHQCWSRKSWDNITFNFFFVQKNVDLSIQVNKVEKDWKGTIAPREVFWNL